MGIAIQTIPSSTSASATSGAAGASDTAFGISDSVTGGADIFAALLSQQLMPAEVQSSLAGTNTSESKTKGDSTEEDATSLGADGLAVLPGVLSELLGQKPTPTASTSNTAESLSGAVGSATDSGSKQSALGLNSMSQGAGSIGNASSDAQPTLTSTNPSAAQETSAFADSLANSEGKADTSGTSLTASAQASPQVATAHGTSSSNTANLTLSTPLHSANWSNDLGHQISWMARNDQQSAVISINPPELGPIQISLNLDGDQATANFVAPSQETRQALEDALPRLRDMLSSSGINLGQANVGSQMPGQQGQFADSQSQSSNSSRSDADNAILRDTSGSTVATTTRASSGGRGMVDLFA